MPPSFVEAFDACSPVFYSSSDTVVPHPSIGMYLVRRTFEVTDVYGNSNDTLQTFTVLDTVPPVFTFVPPGDTLLCSDAPPVVQAQAVDNCSEVTVVFSEETTLLTVSGTTPSSAISRPSICRQFERGHPGVAAPELHRSRLRRSA